jgi:hypothetical protein
MKAFEEYMKGRLGEEWGNAGSLWETERLEKLKMMLDYERSGNDEDDWWKETSYMTLEKFKLRRVLPEPETVYGD